MYFTAFWSRNVIFWDIDYDDSIISNIYQRPNVFQIVLMINYLDFLDRVRLFNTLSKSLSRSCRFIQEYVHKYILNIIKNQGKEKKGFPYFVSYCLETYLAKKINYP